MTMALHAAETNGADRSAIGYRERRRADRARRRALANRDIRTVVDRTAPPAKNRRSASMIGFMSVSLVLHPALAAALSLLPKSEARKETYQPVQINIVDAPEPAPPPPLEAPKPEEPKPPARSPVPLKVEPRKIEAEPAEPEPPPDSASAEPSQGPTAGAPRRVVGISMESTTTGGSGPTFAAGTTRMGSTSRVAQEPGPSLVSAFVPPRRTLAREPVYPGALRARNVEGEVGLRVQIDPTGHVTEVTVIRSSGRPEFDRAAALSASESTYEPARARGVAVAYGIEFTVRFHLH